MTVVGARARMYDDRKEAVEALGLGGGDPCAAHAHLVRNLQLEREGNSIRKLLEALELLNVLEALEVEREHVGQPLDAHALVRLLQREAAVAVELVVRSHRLVAREVAQAISDR